jgi:ketosteroid isomerase-like protein
MKKLSITLIIVSFIGMQSCQQNKDTINQELIDEVSGILKQYSTEWSEAIRNGDASGIVDYFAQDFIYQSATGELQTKDELLNSINQNANPILSYSLEDMNVSLYRKDLANVTGAFNTTRVDQNGQEQLFKSRFTNVWQKSGGKWQCIIGHGNPLLNPDPESDLAKIRAIPTKATDAINSGEFQAWLGLLDENVQVLFIGHKTLNGKKEIIAEMGKYWENPESNYSIEHYETRLLGDYAFGLGTVKGTEKNPDTGKIEIVNSRESVLFKKQPDGEWKVLRLMVNQNQ